MTVMSKNYASEFTNHAIARIGPYFKGVYVLQLLYVIAPGPGLSG